MLRNAIDAKNSKINNKLKMVELQLKKMKIDKDGGENTSDTVESEGYVISDRNELMKKLMKKD
jgi:competence protein ComGC